MSSIPISYRLYATIFEFYRKSLTQLFWSPINWRSATYDVQPWVKQTSMATNGHTDSVDSIWPGHRGTYFLRKILIKIFIGIIFRLWFGIYEPYFHFKSKLTETKSASDQNSYMLFLRNKFLKIFDGLFTITSFTEMPLLTLLLSGPPDRGSVHFEISFKNVRAFSINISSGRFRSLATS